MPCSEHSHSAVHTSIPIICLAHALLHTQFLSEHVSQESAHSKRSSPVPPPPLPPPKRRNEGWHWEDRRLPDRERDRERHRERDRKRDRSRSNECPERTAAWKTGAKERGRSKECSGRSEDRHARYCPSEGDTPAANSIYSLEPSPGIVMCGCRCRKPAAQPSSVTGWLASHAWEQRRRCCCSSCPDVTGYANRCQRSSTYGNVYCNECRLVPPTEQEKEEADQIAADQTEKEANERAAVQAIIQVKHALKYWGSRSDSSDGTQSQTIPWDTEASPLDVEAELTKENDADLLTKILVVSLVPQCSR